ncbi:MAG TPA: cyclase family protein [Dehalococcoidia bacterium]|nr:cyclase family protein [Dehalococcoidia bacterium]
MTGENRSVAPVSEWKDITLVLNNELPMMPSDISSEGPVKDPTFNRFFDVDKGDGVTMTRIEMNTHDGTHIDAPLHFMKGGQTIDNMPMDTTVGVARVIEIEDNESIKVAELEPYNIQPGERIIFKTKNSPHVYDKRKDPGNYIYIATETAHYLVDKKVRMVGMDYLTIGDNKQPANIKEVHDTLLGAEVYVIEGLNLDGIAPRDYELICLPLKLEKGDACPCRALLRPL